MSCAITSTSRSGLNAQRRRMGSLMLLVTENRVLLELEKTVAPKKHDHQRFFTGSSRGTSKCMTRSATRYVVPAMIKIGRYECTYCKISPTVVEIRIPPIEPAMPPIPTTEPTARRGNMSDTIVKMFALQP